MIGLRLSLKLAFVKNPNMSTAMFTDSWLKVDTEKSVEYS